MTKKECLQAIEELKRLTNVKRQNDGKFITKQHIFALRIIECERVSNHF